ncbi:MAG: hypothetical protein WCG83_07295 [Candidatus Peregrinibacteria bacterium]
MEKSPEKFPRSDYEKALGTRLRNATVQVTGTNGFQRAEPPFFVQMLKNGARLPCMIIGVKTKISGGYDVVVQFPDGLKEYLPVHKIEESNPDLNLSVASTSGSAEQHVLIPPPTDDLQFQPNLDPQRKDYYVTRSPTVIIPRGDEGLPSLGRIRIFNGTTGQCSVSLLDDTTGVMNIKSFPIADLKPAREGAPWKTTFEGPQAPTDNPLKQLIQKTGDEARDIVP